MHQPIKKTEMIAINLVSIGIYRFINTVINHHAYECFMIIRLFFWVALLVLVVYVTIWLIKELLNSFL